MTTITVAGRTRPVSRNGYGHVVLDGGVDPSCYGRDVKAEATAAIEAEEAKGERNGR